LYEQAVLLRPNSPDAHLSLAGALVKSDQPEKAIRHFQHVLELNPNMLQAFVGLADALFLSNHREDAIRVANQGIAAANAAGDKQTASQLEEWLKNH
jgi:tetratricopeptide (TPR) repeat protein